MKRCPPLPAEKRAKPYKPSGGEPGHDGEPPEMRITRNLPRGRSRDDQGETNVRVDRLEWLASRRMIEEVHRLAGRQLEQDWKLMDFTSYANISSMVSCSGSGSDHDKMSVAKLEAAFRIRDALQAVGKTGELLVIDVVVENLTLTAIAKKRRWHHQGVLPALVTALDMLARHYKMA